MHAHHVPFEGFVAPTSAPEHMSDLRREYRHMAGSGLAKLEASRVAEWVIRGATCDVLVVRPARVSFELP